MKNRKTKSRMTRVDLDAVLKLQREYTYLQCEAKRLFEYSLALKDGNTDAKFVMFDDHLKSVAITMYEMANKIKKLEESNGSNQSTDSNQSPISTSAQG